MNDPGLSAKSYLFGKFTVEEFISDADISELQFNKNDLDGEYQKNLMVSYKVGHIYGMAKEQSLRIKAQRDFVKASLAASIRDALTLKLGGKNPAESRVDSEMRREQDFLDISMAQAKAAEVEQTIESIYYCLNGRRKDLDFYAARERAMNGQRSYSTPV